MLPKEGIDEPWGSGFLKLHWKLPLLGSICIIKYGPKGGQEGDGSWIIKVPRERKRDMQIAIADLRDKMQGFEKRYGMSSEDFYRRFIAGELGDDLDYFEWKALIEGLQEWEKTDRELKELIDAKRSTG